MVRMQNGKNGRKIAGILSPRFEWRRAVIRRQAGRIQIELIDKITAAIPRNCPCDRGQCMQDLEVQPRSIQHLFILGYFV
jgi:hypothetical protein